MALTFEQFFYGIQSIESGGNYKAVGPSVKGNRAYGKYQVMDFNIPGWTKKYYGKSLTPQQFLNNPEAQEAVAQGVLKGYYDTYGADGAAAMWFSGQSNPNSNKSDGYNTVKQYVAKMNAAALKYTGSSSSGGGGGGGGGTPTIDRNVLAEQYGFVQSLFNAVPELKALFDKAVAGTWDTAKFQAALRNTNWWKSHSDKERDYIIKSFNDPATFARDVADGKAKVRDLAAQLGIVGLTDTDLGYLAWGLNAFGWSDSQLKYQLADFLKSPPEGGLAGAGGQFQMKMASTAWANGVQLDQDWYRNYYQGILRGTSTEQQAEQDIRNKAAALFPAYKEQIMAGVNVSDLASPYLQGMSSILEINPADIDLFDPTIKSALNYKDKDGALGAKPLWQFEVDMRKDPRWVKTSNAREGLMGVAHKVAQDMGVLF